MKLNKASAIFAKSQTWLENSIIYFSRIMHYTNLITLVIDNF